MPRVTFTQNIQRHVACPPASADGRTVREVLEHVFAANPRAREYVLDDQGAVLHVDETGDRLAFGTTTGSVWVSENQGDSWEAVSEHLLPVYCLRFA